MSLHQPISASGTTPSRPVAFDQSARAAFAGAYPDRPQHLTHHLSNHPLLTVDALAQLAERMPEGSVEYNRSNLPIGIRPEDTPTNGLTLGETIRTIESNGSWAVLKHVERDPAYAALLDEALEDIRPLVEASTGPMLHKQAFIFLSSPNSVTPFHMDPEHNILLQIRGNKVMNVFPTHDVDTVPPEKSESFSQGGHRNLIWDDAFLPRATAIPLQPGEAVLVPVKAPHFVKSGEVVSVSFSITWRSRRSVAEGELHSLNGKLRARGLPLITVSHQPEKQWFGRGLYRLAERLGL